MKEKMPLKIKALVLLGGALGGLSACNSGSNYPETGDTGSAKAKIEAVIDYNQVAYDKDKCDINPGDTVEVLDESYLRGWQENLGDSIVYQLKSDKDCTGWATYNEIKEGIDLDKNQK